MINKPTKKQYSFKGPLNKISVSQKFWARIDNSATSKSVYINLVPGKYLFLNNEKNY